MRRLCLMLGSVLLILIWAGPLLDTYRESFVAHMLAHMGIVAIAAPLIAIGLSGTWWDFSGRHVIFSPVPASFVELVVVWVWHAPAVRILAKASPGITGIEQASFLAAGLLLWLSCLNASSRGGRAAGTFGLLLTSVHITLLGALLALAPRPLYGREDVSCLGTILSAEQDQHLGGVTMLLVGGAVYLSGGLTLLGRLLAASPPTGKAGAG